MTTKIKNWIKFGLKLGIGGIFLGRAQGGKAIPGPAPLPRTCSKNIARKVGVLHLYLYRFIFFFFSFFFFFPLFPFSFGEGEGYSGSDSMQTFKTGTTYVKHLMEYQERQLDLLHLRSICSIVSYEVQFGIIKHVIS